MNWKEYEEMEERLGPEAEEVREAYRDCVIEDLKPITDSVVVDEWGDVIITCNERSDITTSELLSFITLFMEAEGAMLHIKGNKIKLNVY